MDIVLTITFIILGIALSIISYIVTVKKISKPNSKRSLEDYMMNNLVIGQKGRIKFI